PQHRPRPLPLFLAMLRSETAADPERMERALAGLRRDQDAERAPPSEPMAAIAEAEGAMLRDYAPGSGATPILFIPSLINPPNILDLSADKSLLRWLAAQGHRPLLVDWGWDVARRRDLDVAGHVERILLPLIRALDSKPILVGYCLGGTMAVAAAGLAQTAGLVTIAAPWHFDGFPADSRAMLGQLWRGSEATARALGLLPMEMLQSAFWSLDPERTVSKFEAFAAMDPESPQARAFVALEDWANDGPPIPEAAAREMFEGLFGADLPGSGKWMVGGKAADPANLPCPSLHIVSTSDRIVPRATAPRAGERIELGLGHVGMVIGGRAREALWEPLSAWLFRVAASC
ncbi:MAG: alpha/beta fold hydrolase, partial [Allosphingosinicella sp.]